MDDRTWGEPNDAVAREAAAPRPSLPAAAFRAGLTDPVVVILLLAALFDDLAGNGIHSVLLAATAGAVAWARGREEAGRPARARTLLPHRRAVARARGAVERGATPSMVVIALLGAWVLAGFARYSWPATLAVAAIAAAGVAVAWPGPLPGAPPPRDVQRVGVVAWVSMFVALGLWELTNLLLQPSLTTDSRDHPTLSVLTDPALGTHGGRFVGLVLWLGLGWSLVRR